jgi:ABC-2 type transport system ATP-binding protein
MDFLLEREALAVSVENVTKIFGRKMVLNHVSFTVPRGRILGLLGHNGAGKTTLFRIILGLFNPSGGTVRIFGVDPRTDPGVRAHMGYVSELLGLYSSLSVRENLIRFGNLQGIPDGKELAENLIEKLDLHEYADVKIKKLSAGIKQRVAIARAMMNNPDLLILDEFLANVDPTWRHNLKEMMKALRKEGVTILMATHILTDVEELCDDVAIIRSGQILYTGSLDALYQRTKLRNLPYVRINTNDNSKAHQILAHYDVTNADDGALIMKVRDEKDTSQIVQALTSQGLSVYEVSPLKLSLEAIYSRLMEVKGDEESKIHTQ